MYVIKSISGRREFDILTLSEEGFDGKVACTPWGGSNVPRVIYCIRHDGSALYAAMRTYEEEIRAEVREHQGMIHTDSCMEFFFSPCPEESVGYFNMEANPLGKLKFNFGEGRKGRRTLYKDPKDFDMTASRRESEGWWQITFTVPYERIRDAMPQFTGDRGTVIRANLYKCGEAQENLNFLTAFPIDTERFPRPDFHRPECFGEMIFD